MIPAGQYRSCLRETQAPAGPAIIANTTGLTGQMTGRMSLTVAVQPARSISRANF
jgi:hypothetical protein